MLCEARSYARPFDLYVSGTHLQSASAAIRKNSGQGRLLPELSGSDVVTLFEKPDEGGGIFITNHIADFLDAVGGRQKQGFRPPHSDVS